MRKSLSSFVVSFVVAGALTPAASAGTATPLLYIANRGAGTISAYLPDSQGAVSPVLTIGGSQTGLSDPWAVAFDRNGSLYAQNYLSSADTDVYAPQANGDVAPTSVVQGNGRDSEAIAVDSQGNVYVARNQPPGIEVFAPGSSGYTTPIHTITPDGYATSLSVDGNDNLIAAVTGTPNASAGNNGVAIETFAPGADGNATPIRRISGSATELGNTGAWGGLCEVAPMVHLTFSPHTGRLYVGVSYCGSAGTGTPHVSVFPGDGDGNIAPVRTIAGSATGLSAMGEILGITADQVNGNIYVLDTSGTNTAQILAYGRFQDGNTTPLYSFTDATTNCSDTRGIAVSP